MSKEGNIQSMDQLKMRCPSCNAYIIIKEGNNKCPYCGRELYVENKPDKIEINTIYNVGSDDGSSKSKKKLGIGAIVGIIIVVMVIINLIAGFALIPFITMHNANVSVNDIINNVSKSTYTARTSVRSQLLQKFCEVAFEKPFSQVTSSDYDRIKSIDIGSYSYDDHTIIIKYILDDLDIEREFYCDADIYDIDEIYMI